MIEEVCDEEEVGTSSSKKQELPSLPPITNLPCLSPVPSEPVLTLSLIESPMMSADSQEHLDITCPALPPTVKSWDLSLTPPSVGGLAARLGSSDVPMSSPLTFSSGSALKAVVSPVQGLLTEGSQEGQSQEGPAPGSADKNTGLAALGGLSARMSEASMTPAAGMALQYHRSTCPLLGPSSKLIC